MSRAEASRRNLIIARRSNPICVRSDQESQLIKRLIWQPYYVDGDPPTQQEIARQLGVSQSYVSRVYRLRAQAWEALTEHSRVGIEDLRRAQSRRIAFQFAPDSQAISE